MKTTITPAEIYHHRLRMPSSKSHTIRALLFASLAEGQSCIRYPLASPDIDAMLLACESIGATVIKQVDALVIDGTQGKINLKHERIDAGNSGQVARFMSAIAACGDEYFVMDGDESIRTNRPMTPLLEALSQRGVRLTMLGSPYRPPIGMTGPLSSGVVNMDGQDSQPVSAMLMAAALLDGTTEINVINPGEAPWIALTLSWLRRCGIEYKQDGDTQYRVKGRPAWPAFDYDVASDYSALAFFAALAVIAQTPLTFEGFDPEDVQGDKIVLNWLQSMGARIDWEQGDLTVMPDEILRGGDFDMSLSIDSVPMMAVLGCFSSGPVHLYNAAIARKKECDRLAVMTTELKKMGAKIELTEDSMTIMPSKLKGSDALDGHCDHRVVMALSVAALHAEGSSVIDGTEWVKKSFPDFFIQLQKIQEPS